MPGVLCVCALREVVAMSVFLVATFVKEIRCVIGKFCPMFLHILPYALTEVHRI